MSFNQRLKVTLRKDHGVHFLIGAAIGVAGLYIEVKHSFLTLYWPTLLVIQIVAYGTEFIQNYIPNRHVDATDAFATVSGGVAGILLFELGLDVMYRFQYFGISEYL